MVRIVDSGDSGGYTGAGGGEVTAEVLITRRQETLKLNVESGTGRVVSVAGSLHIHTTSV